MAVWLNRMNMTGNTLSKLCTLTRKYFCVLSCNNKNPLSLIPAKKKLKKIFHFSFHFYANAIIKENIILYFFAIFLSFCKNHFQFILDLNLIYFFIFINIILQFSFIESFLGNYLRQVLNGFENFLKLI
jgi:hypothetical protein